MTVVWLFDQRQALEEIRREQASCSAQTHLGPELEPGAIYAPRGSHVVHCALRILR